MSKADRHKVRAIAEDLEILTCILEEHAPPFAYFGAIEGDGANFGFWPSMEALDEAVREGEVWKDDGKEPCSVAAVDGWRYRMVISDHGNVSLYYRNGREVWGIV